MNKLFLLLSTIALLSVTSVAIADDDSVGAAICVAVMPCDEAGDLMAEFQDPSSPCYETYKFRCEEFDRSLEETGVCRKQDKEIKRLKKQVRLLKRAVKR